MVPYSAKNIEFEIGTFGMAWNSPKKDKKSKDILKIQI